MPNREALHALVDALSEDVLEHAERVLTHCLSWPQPSPDIQELKARVHQRVHQVEMVGRQQASDRRVPGEMHAESKCIPPGTGYVSQMSWINNELIQVTLLRVRGLIVERLERVGVTDDGVRYSVEVTGPTGDTAPPFTAKLRKAKDS